MADNYGMINAYKAYMTARGRLTDLSDDDDITAGLLVASEWLDGTYLTMFPGLKTGGRDQIREWPRTGVTDMYGYSIASDSVPREVEYATYEATQRQIDKPGSLTVDYVPNKYKRASVDGAVSVEWSGVSSSADVQSQFTIIDQILAPLLMDGVGNYSSLSGDAVRA